MNGKRDRYSALPAPKAPLAWGLITLGLTLWLGSELALSLSGHAYLGIVEGNSGEALSLATTLALALFVVTAPFWTRHEVGSEGIVISMGPLFRGQIAFDNIASAQLTDRKPLGGLGLRLYPNTIFVLTWPDNLVSIRLRQPQRFRILGIVPIWKVSEVVVNVADPRKFSAAVRSRIPNGTDGIWGNS